MGVLDELALSGIGRLERSLGPKAALRALVPLLDTLPAGEARARGILRAIRYAVEVGDRAELAALCVRWIEDGWGAREARRAVLALAGRGAVDAAVELAQAEVLRTTGRYEEGAARYALGRCLEMLGRLDAALLEHEMAAHLANEQPRLRARASLRAARVLARLGRGDEAAARAAALLPLDRAPDEDRLAAAVLALGSPGRYARAAALDVLGAIAARRDALGETAARFAARHAERAGLALSAIEADRIEAILAPRSREAAARVRILAAIAEGAPGALAHAASADPAAAAILPRARAVLDGGAPGPRPDGGRALVGWLGLSACAAIGRGTSAAALLEELRALVRAGARPEAPAWTAATLALSRPRLREAAIALAAALLAAEGEPPPRGYAALAEALNAAGSELSTEALRRAAARREPGARDHLSRLVRHQGWRAAEEGDRAKAIALLREARRLAGA